MPNYNNYFPAGYGYMYPQNQQMPNNNRDNDFIWVTGKAGADAYNVAPNSRVILWDSDAQVVYIKSADAMGRPSMQILDYTIRQNDVAKANPLQGSAPQTEYVTRAELEERLKQLKENTANEQSALSAVQQQ